MNHSKLFIHPYIAKCDHQKHLRNQVDITTRNSSDGYGSSGNDSTTSSKSIIVIRDFERSGQHSETSGAVKTSIEKCIYTTNVTLPTTTITNSVNSSSATNNATITVPSSASASPPSSTTTNTIVTYKNDKQYPENSIRLIQPHINQKQFDSSVSESYDSSSYTCDSSSYTNSSTVSSTNSSINSSVVVVIVHQQVEQQIQYYSSSPKTNINVNRENTNTIHPGQESGHYISIITSSIHEDNNTSKKDSTIIVSPPPPPTTTIIRSRQSNAIDFSSSGQSSTYANRNNNTSINIDNRNNVRNVNCVYNDSDNDDDGDADDVDSDDDEDEVTINTNDKINIKSNKINYIYHDEPNNTHIIHKYHNTLNNSTVIVTASPYNKNNSSNNNSNNTRNNVDDGNTSDTLSKAVNNSSISSVNGANSVGSTQSDNYRIEKPKQAVNYYRTNTTNIHNTSLHNSRGSNTFQLTMYPNQNENINNSNSNSNNNNNKQRECVQDSDVSFCDIIPMSPSTSKSLKRFILARSPASSPSILTTTSNSAPPSPLITNNNLNDKTRTPLDSVLLSSNTRIQSNQLSRVGFANDKNKTSATAPSTTTSTTATSQHHNVVTSFSLPSKTLVNENVGDDDEDVDGDNGDGDDGRNRWTLTPFAPYNRSNASFSQRSELQLRHQATPLLAYQHQHQQHNQRIITPNSNNNNYVIRDISTVKSQNISSDEENRNTSYWNSSLYKSDRAPLVLPKPGFWTPDVRSSRKAFNIYEDDSRTKVCRWFEKFEASRLLIDFGLPITGFSPNLSSLAFSQVPEWFHGILSREQAERLLTQTDRRGSFLLHLNESFPGYVISVYTSSYCDHFLVSVIATQQQTNNNYNNSNNNQTSNRALSKSTYQLFGVANPEQFTDLRDLVKYYSVHSLSQSNSQLLLVYPVGQENPALPDYLDIFYSRPDPNSSTRF
ncbi:unnamed protein product [Trichobilharzia szidati]|nr:unnamed protein product [Trichobilharzia szidati]